MKRSIGRLTVICMALLAAAVPGSAVMAQDTRDDRGAHSEAMMEAAKEAQQAGEWREAAAAWAAVTERDPENGAAWFNLGYCLHADGQIEKAIKIHRKAARFDDYEGIALYNLGCAYALSGRSGQAFDALEASMEAGFDVADAATNDSDLASLRDDPRFARFTRSHSRPSRGGGWNVGGGEDIGAMIGEMFGVVRSFLAENAPKTEGMFLELAQHAAATLNMLHKELSENENFAPLAEMFGQWMGGGERHSAMARREHEAHRHDHDHGHAHDHDRDEAHDNDHDHGDDLPLRERVESRPPRGLDALAATAQRHQQAGNWDEAIEAWTALLEEQPDIGGAWFSLGYALHAKGDLEQAVKIHKKAAKFDEFEGIATYNLGCAYALMGRKDQAFRALRAAHEAGFDIASAMPGDSDLKSLRSDRRYDELLEEASGH